MVNNVVLMGRLVADPKLRHTDSNLSVTNFTLAVEKTYKTPDGQRQADFIDIVAWRQTAEFICNYFSKGQLAS